MWYVISKFNDRYPILVLSGAYPWYNSQYTCLSLNFITIFHFFTEKNNTVKQADTILLTYPLNWNMSRDIARNDLYLYKDYTDSRTPAMTHSFMAVGWKWVKEETELLNSFEKSYQDYTIAPFQVCC